MKDYYLKTSRIRILSKSQRLVMLSLFLIFGFLNVNAQTAPEAVSDGDSTDMGVALNMPAPGVLGNDSDSDGDPITVLRYTIEGVAGTFIADGSVTTIPGQGTIAMNADGSYTFTPEAAFHGNVHEILYHIGDDEGKEDETYLRIYVDDGNNHAAISITSCNRGYIQPTAAFPNGAYKIRYNIALKNDRIAYGYDSNTQITGIQIINDLEAIFGDASILQIDREDFAQSDNGDGEGSTYPRHWMQAGFPWDTAEFDASNDSPGNGGIIDLTATNTAGDTADHFILYPRQTLSFQYCVYVDPAVAGGYPANSGSGIDFANSVTANTSDGNSTNDIDLLDFHTTDTFIAASLHLAGNTEQYTVPVNTDGTYTFTNRVTITNDGPAAATPTKVNYNYALGRYIDDGITFTTLALSIASGPALTLNPAFDGDANAYLLADNQTLAPGETIEIDIAHTVAPTSYHEWNYFSTVGPDVTLGNADGTDESSAAIKRLYSFVTWTDARGDHIDRFDESHTIPYTSSSDDQCSCEGAAMLFPHTSTVSLTKETLSDVETPGNPNHRDVTFRLKAKAPASNTVQVQNLDLQDNLNSICGGIIQLYSVEIPAASPAVNTAPTINPAYVGDGSGTNIFNDDGILDPGDEVWVDIKIEIDKSCTGTNTATFDATNPEGDDLTYVAASVTLTGPSADLVTVKSVNNSTPTEGDTVVYNITVTNNGPDNETGITLTDVLPAGVTYASHSGGSYDSGTGVWNIGNLANGANTTLSISATVDANTGGTTITNTTTAADGDSDDPTTAGDVLTVDIAPTTPIVAQDDSASINGSVGGTAINNVLEDNGNGADTLGGAATTTADVTISLSGAIPAGIHLDTATGAVTVDAGTAAGNYTFDYQICQVADPANCTTATVTLNVTVTTINAEDDDLSGTVVNGNSGGVAGNVFANNGNGTDTVNGNPADDANTVTPVVVAGANTTLTGATIDENGDIIVPAGTHSGTYTVEYQVCADEATSICDTAIATIVVASDSDGDGIDDFVDLDDDNDGIPDVDEVTCSASEVLDYSINSAHTVLNGISVSGPVGGFEVSHTLTGNFGSWEGPESNNQVFNIGRNGDDFNDPGIMTYDFNKPLSNFIFSIRDLDRQYGGTEQVEVRAYYNGIEVAPVSKTLGVNIIEVSSLVFEATTANNAILSYDNGVIFDYGGKFVDRLIVTQLHTVNQLNQGIIYTLEGGCVIIDSDNDGIPDMLDIDSDNDGIPDVVEAGGVDADHDGHVDYPTAGDPSTMTDADGDGLADEVDNVDSGSGAGEVTSGTALANPDTDGDGVNDVVDIDADNDGIVDNIEGQTTTGYTPPSGIDSDHDGLDDAYDQDDEATVGIGGGTGTAIAPTNTDGADNPDYTDTDSDNDGRNDAIEGWDTNNDGTAETTPSGNDADHDGLDDAYDQNDSQANPTNGQTPSSFPDLDNPGGDRDWRQVLANPELTVTKDDQMTYGTQALIVGQVFTYNIEVTNSGNVDLTNITVSDANATVSGSPIASLAVGASSTITATHTVTQEDIDNGSISNSATASTTFNGTPVSDDSDDTDPLSPAGDDDATITTITQTPELTLTKQDAIPANVTVGDDVTYTIVVTNTGNVTVSNITITDNNATPANITVGTLAPGAIYNATATHTITQSDMNDGGFDNVATVAGQDPSGAPVSDISDDPDDPTTTTGDVTHTDLVPYQEISMEASLDDNNPSTSSSPATLNDGDTVTYTLNVENTGNVDVTPVAPAGYTLQSGDNGDGVLNPGEVWVYTTTHIVDQTDIDAGQIDNTVTVNATDATPAAGALSDVSDDPQDPTNNDTEADGEGDDVTHTYIAQTPELTVTKADAIPAGATVGSLVSYTIVVTNSGNVTLNDVVVTDANADAGSIVYTGGSDVDADNDIDTLAPGASATITATHLITQDDMDNGGFDNTAVASTTFDGNPVTDVSDDPDTLTDNDTTHTDLTPYQVVSVEASLDDADASTAIAPSALSVGDDIDYTMSVTNTGNVSITPNIPEGYTLVAGGDTNGDGMINPGETWTYTTTHTVDQSDVDNGQVDQTDTFTGMGANGTSVSDVSDDPQDVTDNDVEGDGEGDDVTSTYILQTPELTTTKVATAPAANATVGDDVVYTIVVTNTGNVTVSNILITDSNASPATISAGTLAPGATYTGIVTHTITQSDMNAGTFDNQASVSGQDPAGNPVTDTSDDPGTLAADDATIVDITANQVITIEASLDDNISSTSTSPAPLDAGDIITYTLNVENTGNVDVTPATPAGYTLQGGDDNGDGVLNPGEVWVYTTPHTVDQTDLDAGQIDNTVTVNATDATPAAGALSDVSDDPQDPTNNDTEADGEGDDVTHTFVVQTPELTITKQDAIPAGATVGSLVSYTIVVTNSGNVTLNDVVVTDANADAGSIVYTGGSDVDADNDIDTLAPGASATITATHLITQDDMDNGGFDNVAVASTTFDGNPVTDVSDDPDTLANNDVTHTDLTPYQVVSAEASLDDADASTAAIPSALSVGDDIDYTMSVVNTGNVSITPSTPAGYTYTGVGDTNGDGMINPGETWVYTATHTVDQSDIDNGQVDQTDIFTGIAANGVPVSDVSDDPQDATNNDVEADGEGDDVTSTYILQAPELTVTKADAIPANATIGDDIVYTIIVTNSGNVTLSDVVVTDANALIGGNATIASLAPGASATLTATHTITLADMNNGGVDNVAVATGNDTNGNPVTDNSDDPDTMAADDATHSDLTPNQHGELIATLTDNIVSDPGNPATMFAGDNINYTLNVENTGNVSITNPTVPAGYTSVDQGGFNVGDTNGDGIQDPGETWVYTATHSLTQAEIDAGIYSTQVDVSGTAPNGNVTDTSDDPETTADNDQTSTYFNLVSELDVIKTDALPLFIQVGQDITYTITVTNTGNTTINNINVTDANAVITAGNPIASLAPGAHADVTAVHTITQDDMDAGYVSNTAQASGTNTAGDTVEDTSSNDPDTPDSNDPTVSTIPQHPSILTVKREVNYVDNGLVGNSAGDVIEYEISVENTGDVTVHNVSVTDLLVTNAGGIVVYDRGDTDGDGQLDVDETWVFTATYTVTQADMDAGQVVNTATAYVLAPDGTPLNDVSDDDILTGPTDNPTTTNLVQDPKVEITKVDVLPANVAVGQVITYNLVVTNTGNVTLYNVNVADTNAVMNGVGSASELAPGNSVTFTAVHEITQADMNAGTISNQATVTGTDPNGTDITDLSDDTDNPADIDAEGDGEPDDITVTDLTPFQETGIAVSLTDNLPTNASNPTNMNVGEVITYTAGVTNTGNVSVTPNVPAGYTAVEQGGVNVGDTNGDGVLDPGETWIYEATHTITQADIDLGTVTETVTFTGTAANGDSVSDISDDPDDMTDNDADGDGEPDDNTVTYIGQNPELTTTKAGVFVDGNANGLADVDEVIAYTITVTNTGNVTLTNVVVTDPNATILTGSPIATLAPGASATVTAEHVLVQADIDAGEVENQATATGEDPNGDPVIDITDDPSTLADNDATITTVPVHSEVTMTKVGVFADANGDNYAQPGELIKYTFEVTNAGNQTISNVSIDDAFLTAAGVSYVSGDTNGNGLLDVGETWVYSGEHVLTQADIDAGNVDNQALVTAEDPEGNTLTDLSDDPNNPANDDVEGDNEPDDVTNTLVPQYPEIEITKTGHFNDENGNGLADVGETISYAFVVTNTGNVTLTDVIVTDVLVDVDGTAVILAPGDSDNSTFTAIYVITKEDIRTGYVTNTAVAHGTDPQGNVITDDSDDPTVADSNPDTPTVIETTGIIITDIFTPNGDGTNDVWAVPGIQNFAHNNVKIYNRWGNLVYEKDHYVGDWNGISNGRMTIQQSKLLPVGTYYYVIDLGNGHEPFVGYLYLKK